MFFFGFFFWSLILALCARRALVLFVFHSDVLLAIVLFSIVSLRLRNRQVLYELRGRYSFLVTLFPTGFLVPRF